MVADSYRANDTYTAGDSIYVQTNSAWTDAGATFAFYFEDDDSHSDWSPILGAADAGGYIKYSLEAKFDFNATKVALYRFAPGRETPSKSDTWGNTSLCNATKMCNCLWLPDTVRAEGGFFGYDVYSLTIGGTEKEFAHVDGGYRTTFTSIKANDEVSLTRNNVDFSFTTNAVAHNNVSSSKRIKVDGSSKSVWLGSDMVLWVDGYASASEPLNHFCDHLLTNTLTDGKCVTISSSVVSSLSEEYGALGDAQTTFKSQEVVYGDSASYESVVQEAYTRYCYLVSNSRMADFVGVLSAPSANMVGRMGLSNDEAIVTISAVIASMAVVSSLGFFLLRKRREN